MDFDIPQDLQDYLKELDDFIDREITPLQMQDDNNRFFDYRREDARPDWHRGYSTGFIFLPVDHHRRCTTGR